MSKALETLKEFITRVDNEFLLNEVNLNMQKASLDEWKNQFKEIILGIVKSIAEYSLFTSDEEKEKYDCDTNEQRKQVAEDFIKEHIDIVKNYTIEKLMHNYFKVYLPEKEVLYENYFQNPLKALHDSFDFRCIEDEVIFKIMEKVRNIYSQYKNDLTSLKIIKMISMHYKMDAKFESMNTDFLSKEERKYILKLKEQNILDMLEEYKKFVEGTENTDQNFVNQVVYAQMILKQNFLKHE